MNKHFSLLAADVLRRRLSKKLVVIRDNAIVESKDLQIENYDNPIIIQTNLNAKKFLKYFGKFITNLKIEYQSVHPSNKIRVNRINNLINLHCAETLKNFEISTQLDNFLDEFTKSFKNVEDLVLNGRFKSLNNSELNLNQIFPAMKSLIIDGKIRFTSGDSGLDQNFSHLKHLELYIVPYEFQEFLTESIVRNLIRKNKQITSLRLIQPSRKLLKVASICLPSLDSLDIQFYDDRLTNDENQIYFPNVKKLVTHHSYIPFQNVIFGNLKEFQYLKPMSAYCHRWTQLVKNNSRLRKLITNFYINNEELTRLASSSEHLTEIYISVDDSVDIETIIRLIQKNTHLKKMHLKFKFPNKNRIKSTLKAMLKSDNTWEFNEFMNLMIIERKL